MARGGSGVAALLLAAAVALAGCLGGEPQEPAQSANATSGAPDDAGGPAVDSGLPTDAVGTGGRNDPGSRAHKHDYWAGRTEVTLVDADVEPTALCGYYSLDDATNLPKAGCAEVRMGNGSIVYQGTSKLAFTATWNDPKVTSVVMRYRDAQTARPEFLELVSGTPLEIPVDTTTADMAHSKESKWLFSLYGGTATGPGALEGPVHVTITIYRGLDLPLDPPHPDFWADATEIDLGNVSGTIPAVKGQFALFFAPTFPDTQLAPGRIVPPGTRSMEVRYTWTVRDPTPGVGYSVHPFVKSAESPEYVSQERDFSGSGSYTIDVTPEMVDSPYATESQWRFAFFQDQHDAATGVPHPVSAFGTSPLNKDMDYTLHVVVRGGHDMDALAST